MALVERTPNLIFSSRLVGRFLAKEHADHADPVPEIDACEAIDETDHATGQAHDHEEEVQPPRFGDHASAFRLTKLIAAADAENANVIGIVGARRGAGASLASRQLAGALASFGRDTLLIDASGVSAISDSRTHTSTSSILESAELVRPSLSFAELAPALGDDRLWRDDYAKTIASLAQAGRTIVIDLPPIVGEDGSPNTVIRDFGAACDLVFLVCPTGEIRRKELIDCVETCKVVGLELNGMILNDWQLPVSSLLED